MSGMSASSTTQSVLVLPNAFFSHSSISIDNLAEYVILDFAERSVTFDPHVSSPALEPALLADSYQPEVLLLKVIPFLSKGSSKFEKL
jgi:hypothetical protein